MAKFNVSMQTPGKLHSNDYFDLEMDGEAANEVKLRVCKAGAVVLIEKLRAHLKSTTEDRNENVRGTLANSLSIREGRDSVFVAPKGKHHGKNSEKLEHRPKTGEGKSHKRNHHGMSGTAVSAQDVGYYLEYGTPRMSAEHWMETTLEKSEEEIVAAMEAEWNAYLDSKGV